MTSANELAKDIVEKLSKNGMKVSTAESITGGLIAKYITDIPGSSAVFEKGFVTYSDKAKHDMLRVKKKTLKQFTAVSFETAYEMSHNVREIADTDYSVAITGYASATSGVAEEDVGHVFIGVSCYGVTDVYEYQFGQMDRNELREFAATIALRVLKEMVFDIYEE